VSECARCTLPAGFWFVRLRKAPTDARQAINLGKLDPGAWWKRVKKYFDVTDAPSPDYWLAPELIALAAPKCGPEPDVLLCGYCRSQVNRNQTASLFETEEHS